MRKYLSRIIPVVIVLWVFLYTPAGVMTGSGAQDNVGWAIPRIYKYDISYS